MTHDMLSVGQNMLQNLYMMLFLFLDIDQNMLSVGQLIEKGFKVIFEDEYCFIKDATNQNIFKVKMKGKSFSLNPLKEKQYVFLSQRRCHLALEQETRTLSSSWVVAAKRTWVGT